MKIEELLPCDAELIKMALIAENKCDESIKMALIEEDEDNESLRRAYMDALLRRVTWDGCIIYYFPKCFKTYEVCLAAVKQNLKAIRYVPEEFIEHIKQELDDMPPYERCMLEVKKDGLTLGDIPFTIRDYPLCLAAVKQNGESLMSAPLMIIDYDLCIAAVKQNLKAIEYVPKPFLEDIKQELGL